MFQHRKHSPRRSSAWFRAATLLLATPAFLWSQQLRKNELAAPIADPVSIEIQVQPSDISIEAKQTNKAAYWFVGGIFGLMAASSVDKSRGKQANELASELRNLLNTFDFRPELTQRFESGLNPVVLPILGEVRFRSPNPQEPAGAPTEPTQDQMSIHYSYTLIDEFRSLQVTLTSAVWNPGTSASLENLSEDQIRRQARYYQVFTYELTPEAIAGLKEPRQRAGGWLGLGKDQIGTLLVSGMNALADALSYDLGSPGTETSLKQPPDASTQGVDRLILETGTQRWIRASTGEITILEVN